jgi:hypothetical protein
MPFVPVVGHLFCTSNSNFLARFTRFVCSRVSSERCLALRESDFWCRRRARRRHAISWSLGLSLICCAGAWMICVSPRADGAPSLRSAHIPPTPKSPISPAFSVILTIEITFRYIHNCYQYSHMSATPWGVSSARILPKPPNYQRSPSCSPNHSQITVTRCSTSRWDPQWYPAMANLMEASSQPCRIYGQLITNQRGGKSKLCGIHWGAMRSLCDLMIAYPHVARRVSPWN